MKKNPLVLVALAAATLGGAACGGHNHLTKGWSESYHAHFDRQTVNPQAGEARKPQAGLDTQEARIITKTHRTNMAKQADYSSTGSGVMVVTPQGEARTGGLPPPSVPGNQ